MEILKVYPIRIDPRVVRGIERWIEEHPGEYEDKSDFVRKSVSAAVRRHRIPIPRDASPS